jgi:predicted nucleotidyltransferase
MAQIEAVVRDKVLQFYESARQSVPIRKVLVYGSHAKGRATEQSDIDVAVVVDEADHAKRIEITSRLFHFAFQVDPAIEPKCVFWDEYKNHEQASILAEIIGTGVEVV